MTSPQENVIGFPVAFIYTKYAPVADIRLWQINPLQCLMAINQINIHDVINSPFYKRVMQESWKIREHIERDLAQEREVEWYKTRGWYRWLGCPV